MVAKKYSKRGAAKAAKKVSTKGKKPFCGIPPRPQPQLAPAVASNGLRAAAILGTHTKWLNNTVLHYCFFTGTSHFAVPKTQADAVRKAFDTWKAVGIGLQFQEV